MKPGVVIEPKSKFMPTSSMNAMQSVAGAAAIGQERVTRQLTVAITGDASSDLMAAIRRVADDSGLSARQVQYIFECYVKLYKDAADQNDRDSAQQQSFYKDDWARTIAEKAKAHYDSSSGTDQTAFEEMKQVMLTRKADQSGTHSPSTMRPDSVGGSSDPCNGLHDG